MTLAKKIQKTQTKSGIPDSKPELTEAHLIEILKKPSKKLNLSKSNNGSNSQFNSTFIKQFYPYLDNKNYNMAGGITSNQNKNGSHKKKIQF